MSVANVPQVTFHVEPAGDSLWTLHAVAADSDNVPSGEFVFRALADVSQRTSAESLCAALRDPALPRAVFFETRPFSASTFHEPFEAVLRDATKQFDALNEDSTAFDVYLDTKTANCTGSAVFPNLGGDAMLIVPTRHPARTGPHVHLLDFMRNAPVEHCAALMHTVGAVYYSTLADARLVGCDYFLWLSTAGLGVYYPHIRIDSHPKYYTTERYRDMKLSSSTVNENIK